MFGANIIKKQQEIAAMTAADALTKIDEAEAKLAKLKAAAYADHYAIMDAHESIMYWHEIHAAKAREEEEAAEQAEQAEQAEEEIEMQDYTTHIITEGPARYSTESITKWREEAVQHLTNMTTGAEPVTLVDSEEWLDDWDSDARWAVTRKGGTITVEWETGPDSWAWVDAEHIIGAEAVQQLLNPEAAEQAETTDEATTEEEAREDRARERTADKVAKVLPADADHTLLIEWALAWHKAVKLDYRHPVDGVIVGEDGTILGETWNQDGTYRVDASTRQKWGLWKNTVDFSLAHISRQAGQKAIHVRSWEVAPRRPDPSTLDLLRELRDRQPSDEHINGLMAKARREGKSIAKIADAAGIKSRNTVYLRTDPLMEED